MGVRTGAANTVTSTVSMAPSPSAVTVSVKVNVVSTGRSTGAVKFGVVVFAPVRVTVGLPPVWVHE